MADPKIPPCLDYTPLEGPPATTEKALKKLKLRRFPASVEDIEWLQYVGHGEEGHVYLARINDYGNVAVKVFWHTFRPPPAGRILRFTWPLETESQIVDLMQKLEAAMSEVKNNPEQTIMIKPGPQIRNDAQANVMAFSKEARESSDKSADESTKPPPPFPPCRLCHGWFAIENSRLPKVRPRMHRQPDPSGTSIAFVYEYVEDVSVNLACAQKFFDFFYEVGLGIGFRPRNWRDGRLLDMNDIMLPSQKRWFSQAVYINQTKESDWVIYETEESDWIALHGSTRRRRDRKIVK
ncbi:hypothetical protein F4806DRAFT_497630 [Annulohypoxylon nitens]|nr:hypothetical protein F4806DRAFT_497630 [Annulohypoxylon nitens]